MKLKKKISNGKFIFSRLFEFFQLVMRSVVRKLNLLGLSKVIKINYFIIILLSLISLFHSQ